MHSQACFKFMSHLLREKQFIALGDSWNAQGENDGAVGDVSGVPGKEERVGILRGGQLRVRDHKPLVYHVISIVDCHCSGFAQLRQGRHGRFAETGIDGLVPDIL